MCYITPFRTTEPVRSSALVHTVRAHKRGNPVNIVTELNSGPGPYPTSMPFPFAILRSSDEHVLVPYLHAFRHW